MRCCWVCGEDISHRAASAKTCGPAHKKARQRCLKHGHTCSVGVCSRCGKQVLLPLSPWKRKRLRHKGGESLRTRRPGDPHPKHAPRPEDFIKSDGSERYEDSLWRSLGGAGARPLTVAEQDWLDRVAPECRERGEHVYWEAPAWKPASYRRELDAVDHTPGPDEDDIWFSRQRGKARREFEEWLA
jgi:hypothetical protein